MDPILIISIAAFVGAAALAAAVFSTVKSMNSTRAEDRLDVLAGNKSADAEVTRGLMKQDFVNLSKGAARALGGFSKSLGSFGTFLEQANSPIDFQTFVLISGGLGLAGVAAGMVAHSPAPLLPVFGVIAAMMPLIWLKIRRKRRFARFGAQLPDALSLLGRALRSGNSLNAGLNMVVEEMPDPISTEFRIAYEEQNLGHRAGCGCAPPSSCPCSSP